MFDRILISLAVVVLAAGCAHAPASASRKYASAPRIENPLLGTQQTRVPGLTNEPDALLFSGYDPQQVCFDGDNHQSPAEATATRYSLRFLNTDDVDLKAAPTLKTSVVKVLNSSSQLVPVTRTVHDTVRDAHGNTIATVDRQVQEMEPHYDTQVRVCFPGPQQALSADARFMVLLRESTNAAWGLRMAPRSYWVWRFPAADTGAPTPVASK